MRSLSSFNKSLFPLNNSLKGKSSSKYSLVTKRRRPLQTSSVIAPTFTYTIIHSNLVVRSYTGTNSFHSSALNCVRMDPSEISSSSNSGATDAPHLTEFCNIMSQIASKGPVFAVDPSKIEIVNTPNDFFQQLVSKIKSAEKKIVLSSLYIGAEPLPMEMLSEIDKRMASNPELKVTILLDYLRGTRNTLSKDTEQHLPTTGSPHEGIVSSASILYPLQSKYPDRVELLFYHTPKLSWFLKSILPERYNEIIGVQHIKCYIVDDDVMISGANLSQQYFTNRQDRYMWINGNPGVSRFYSNLVDVIGGFSYKMDNNGKLVFPNDVPNPVFQPKMFNKFAHQALYDALGLRTQESNLDSNITAYNSGMDMLKTHNTWIFPTIQLGPANLRHDETVSELILGHTPQHMYTTFITSPYFNIADTYKNAIVNSRKPIRMIVASPKANGFFNGSGVSGMIPWAYDAILKEWSSTLPKDADIEFFEYSREGWTFHGKGLWIEMNNPSGPTCSLTLIGSSNLGVRSLERDLESQIALFTTDSRLAALLREERDHIFHEAPKVTPQTFASRDENHSPLLNLVVPFASKFM